MHSRCLKPGAAAYSSHKCVTQTRFPLDFGRSSSAALFLLIFMKGGEVPDLSPAYEITEKGWLIHLHACRHFESALFHRFSFEERCITSSCFLTLTGDIRILCTDR